MARFNLEDYETVEERIKRFYEANEDGRITTENLTTDTDRATGTWIVKASVYLTAGDQANNLPKATGLAFEIDGGQGANQTSALENGTSADPVIASPNAVPKFVLVVVPHVPDCSPVPMSSIFRSE